MDIRSQRVGGRDTTPDRAKMCRLQQQKVKPTSKTKRVVQVVYYLSRNGLLEHPHFLEITLFANDPLRLKDVFDRLIALRGSGLPLQYSWSCKRNYKSGYVWCDLGLNDIIHPAEGAEYVLKGSELVEAGCSGRFQQLNINKEAIHQAAPDPNYNNPKRKSFNCSPHTHQRDSEEYEEYEEEEYEEEEGAEERTSYTSSTTTPHSRCSRGVSTDEDTKPQSSHLIRNTHKNNTNSTSKLVITNKEPKINSSHESLQLPNSTSTLAEKLNQDARVNGRNSERGSKRFEEETESSSAPSRNSVLLQLIACGSSGADFKANNKNEPRRVSNVGGKSACGERRTENNNNNNNNNNSNVFSSSSCCEVEMINYVSENPRFGNLQAEEKEYFSGSLVESMKANRSGSDVEPVLKRSNSYNEERSSRLGNEAEKHMGKEEEKREAKGGGVKGKCIPRKKSSKESKK